MDTSLTNSRVGVIGNPQVGTINIIDPNRTLFPQRLTVLLPTLSPEKIIGRDEELVDLHKRLFDHKQVVLVNGLGGIGKTTLAQAYAGKYLDDYKHLAWVSLISTDIYNDFISTDGLIDNLGIQIEGKKPRTLFIEIVRRLQNIDNGPCLLIIDNADEQLARWYDYLPSQPQWHLLVTSRERIEGFDLKELGFLSEDDAVRLFFSHYDRGNITNDDALKLVAALEYHTLTIEILAKTAQVQRSRTSELLDAIRDDAKANVYVPHNKKGDKIDRVTSYLRSIFSLSKVSDDELLLLKQFICLPPEFQKYKLLEDLIDSQQFSGDLRLSEVLSNVVNKGWLLNNRDTDSFKMHRIIAEVIKTQIIITLADVAGLIDRITNNLLIDQTKDNPVDKFPWIPFGRSLLDVFPSNNDETISELQNNLALVLQALGDYEGAKQLFEKAVASDEKNLGPDHPNTAVSYSNLAVVLKYLGDYEGAKRLLDKGVASDEKNLGPDHPATAGRYSNLATVLRALGDYEGAKGLLDKAVASDENNFGPDHPNTALSYSNLAVVLEALGDYEGALFFSEKSVNVFTKSLPEGHPYIKNAQDICYSIKQKVVNKS